MTKIMPKANDTVDIYDTLPQGTTHQEQRNVRFLYGGIPESFDLYLTENYRFVRVLYILC